MRPAVGASTRHRLARRWPASSKSCRRRRCCRRSAAEQTDVPGSPSVLFSLFSRLGTIEAASRSRQWAMFLTSMPMSAAVLSAESAQDFHRCRTQCMLLSRRSCRRVVAAYEVHARRARMSTGALTCGCIMRLGSNSSGGRRCRAGCKGSGASRKQGRCRRAEAHAF